MWMITKVTVKAKNSIWRNEKTAIKLASLASSLQEIRVTRRGEDRGSAGALAVAARGPRGNYRRLLTKLSGLRLGEKFDEYDYANEGSIDRLPVHTPAYSDPPPQQRIWSRLQKSWNQGLRMISLQTEYKKSPRYSIYTGRPRRKKTGTAYFPQYVDAITDISVYMRELLLRKTIPRSCFLGHIIVRQCRVPNFPLVSLNYAWMNVISACHSSEQ